MKGVISYLEGHQPTFLQPLHDRNWNIQQRFRKREHANECRNKRHPLSMLMFPKVKRGDPVIGSMPSIAKDKPMMDANRPLSKDDEPTRLTTTSANTTRSVFSDGPNLSANWASQEAVRIRIVLPTTSAKTDAYKAASKAFLAWPFFAIA